MGVGVQLEEFPESEDPDAPSAVAAMPVRVWAPPGCVVLQGRALTLAPRAPAAAGAVSVPALGPTQVHCRVSNTGLWLCAQGACVYGKGHGGLLSACQGSSSARSAPLGAFKLW